MNKQTENGKQTKPTFDYGMLGTAQRQNNTSYTLDDTVKASPISSTYKAPAGDQRPVGSAKANNYNLTGRELRPELLADAILEAMGIKYDAGSAGINPSNPTYGMSTTPQGKASPMTGMAYGMVSIGPNHSFKATYDGETFNMSFSYRMNGNNAGPKGDYKGSDGLAGLLDGVQAAKGSAGTGYAAKGSSSANYGTK